jgi:hypothetical protein
MRHCARRAPCSAGIAAPARPPARDRPAGDDDVAQRRPLAPRLHAHAHTHTYAHAHAHTCAQTRTHTYAHTHAHTRRRGRVQVRVWDAAMDSWASVAWPQHLAPLLAHAAAALGDHKKQQGRRSPSAIAGGGASGRRAPAGADATELCAWLRRLAMVEKLPRGIARPHARAGRSRADGRTPGTHARTRARAPMLPHLSEASGQTIGRRLFVCLLQRSLVCRRWRAPRRKAGLAVRTGVHAACAGLSHAKSTRLTIHQQSPYGSVRMHVARAMAGLAPATSAPGLRHICDGTALTRATLSDRRPSRSVQVSTSPLPPPPRSRRWTRRRTRRRTPPTGLPLRPVRSSWPGLAVDSIAGRHICAGTRW